MRSIELAREPAHLCRTWKLRTTRASRKALWKRRSVQIRKLRDQYFLESYGKAPRVHGAKCDHSVGSRAIARSEISVWVAKNSGNNRGNFQIGFDPCSRIRVACRSELSGVARCQKPTTTKGDSLVTSRRRGTPETGKQLASGSAYRGSNPWGQPNLFKHFPRFLRREYDTSFASPAPLNESKLRRSAVCECDTP
jgi:hypothetical protein